MEIKQLENFILKDLEYLEGNDEEFVNSLKLWMEFALKRNLSKNEITKLYHRHQNALEVLINEGLVKKRYKDQRLSDCDIKITSTGWKRLDSINKSIFKRIYYGILPELKKQAIQKLSITLVALISFLLGRFFETTKSFLTSWYK